MNRGLRAAVAGIACAALGSFAPDARGDGGAAVPDVAVPPRSCFERPIVVAYLHHLQDRVMARWVIDEDTAADQRVVVRFRLAEDGSLLTYKLVSWTSRRLADAADLAMRSAGPFGAVPDSATCIVGRSLEIRFENPY